MKYLGGGYRVTDNGVVRVEFYRAKTEQDYSLEGEYVLGQRDQIME